MNRMLGFKNGQKATGINKLCQNPFHADFNKFLVFLSPMFAFVILTQIYING